MDLATGFCHLRSPPYKYPSCLNLPVVQPTVLIMGSSHSQPTTTVDTASPLRPRSLKRLKSTPHSLRPLRPLESASISRSPSPSFNSLSEKHSEKENRPLSLSRKERPCDCVPVTPPLPAKYVQPSSIPVVPHVLLPSPTAGLFSAASLTRLTSESDVAYARFLHDYPQYSSSWHVDALRRSEYRRLAQDQTYVDYMGGALYPASLISVHADFLQTAVLGNTHSESPRSDLIAVIISQLTHPDHSSKLSSALTATARSAVLSFFNAPPGSTVIFTANASAALKLVGEAFPFTPGAAFILPEDAHNSVHGIREFAKVKGAPIVYLSSPPRGGVRIREAFVSPLLVMTHIPPINAHISTAQTLIDKHRPRSGTPALFAYTGQSNITNSKPPLAVLAHAAGRGFTTLLDAAALAPTTPIDLTNTPVDAVAVSFYKMFGFPTGIGALVLAPGIGAWLREKRPWFAGGTVEVVQVPGTAVGRTAAIDEAFEVSMTLCGTDAGT